jgi:hypothetical protein
MYEFNTGDFGFNSGLMKQQANTPLITKSNYGTSILKKIFLQKMLASTHYDTSVYYDFVYPMIFPLIKDSAYVYRDSGDPRGSSFFKRRFLGVETISTKLGQFQTYKFEYLTGLDSVFFYDWIGSNGLLKRYIDAGHSDVSDSIGNIIGKIRTWDISELIGRTDINPDTLKPWGRK